MTPESQEGTSAEIEVVERQRKKESKKIQNRVLNYLARLPASQLLDPRDSEKAYKEVKDADREFESDLMKHIAKLLAKSKSSSVKSMLVRGVCADTIRELNSNLLEVHPNSQAFVGQLLRRIIICGTEISEIHLRDPQGNPQIVDRRWLREFAMELNCLDYKERLGDLSAKLRCYVDNPPIQPAD